jgi:cytochrome c2
MMRARLQLGVTSARWLAATDARANRLPGSFAVASLVLTSVVMLTACAAGATARGSPEPSQQVPGGDPERGREVIVASGCGACHTIPGVPGATARVAPPLIDWGTRTTIVGLVPNTPERLVQWIMDPAELRPGTTMPTVGVSREDALQMAAYLYTLR